MITENRILFAEGITKHQFRSISQGCPLRLSTRYRLKFTHLCTRSKSGPSEEMTILSEATISRSGLKTVSTLQGQPRSFARPHMRFASRPLLEIGRSSSQATDLGRKVRSALPISRIALSVSITERYEPYTLDKSRMQPSRQSINIPPLSAASMVMIKLKP